MHGGRGGGRGAAGRNGRGARRMEGRGVSSGGLAGHTEARRPLLGGASGVAPVAALRFGGGVGGNRGGFVLWARAKRGREGGVSLLRVRVLLEIVLA